MLAAQPVAQDEASLPASTRFMEMVANLTAQTVRLVGQAKTEAEALRTERDSLVITSYSIHYTKLYERR